MTDSYPVFSIFFIIWSISGNLWDNMGGISDCCSCFITESGCSSRDLENWWTNYFNSRIGWVKVSCRSWDCTRVKVRGLCFDYKVKSFLLCGEQLDLWSCLICDSCSKGSMSVNIGITICLIISMPILTISSFYNKRWLNRFKKSSCIISIRWRFLNWIRY